MSEKELKNSRLRGLVRTWAQHRITWVLLSLSALMWLTPWGLKWLLVLQMQQAFKRDVSVQAVRLHPWTLAVSVQGLSVKDKEGGEFLGWDDLTIDVSARTFTQHLFTQPRLELDVLTLQGPRVSVVHLGAGQFDFSDLLSESAPNQPSILPDFVLRHVAVHNGHLTLEDRPHLRTHTLAALQLVLPLVNRVVGGPPMMLTPELTATLNGAPLRLGGTVQLLADALEGALDVNLEALGVAAWQAYLPSTLPWHVTRGKLSTRLNLKFSQAQARTVLEVQGAARVDDLAISDTQERELASFQSLEVSLTQGDVLANTWHVGEAMLKAPRVSARIDSAGQLNWASQAPLAAEQTPQASPAVTATSNVVSASTPNWRVDQLVMQEGAFALADASVTPAVNTRLTQLALNVQGLRAFPRSVAKIQMQAHVNGTSPLLVQAQLQPWAVKNFLDATLSVKQLDLTHFSGYARKYAGYALDKGKLSLEGGYKIHEGQLQANSHVWIQQLRLGEQATGPHVIDAPVSLGVSLLKDSRGNIDIELPMTGTVDAPEFSVGALVLQTLGQLLAKVVTAPARALENFISDDPQD